MSQYIFPSDLNYVKEATQKIIDEISSHSIDSDNLINIKLCFEEAFINAVKHGNGSNPGLKVTVEVVLEENSVGIFIRDQGKGFDFDHCPDPTKDENLQKTNGRGVFLIKNFMDESSYDNNTKCLFIKKYF